MSKKEYVYIEAPSFKDAIRETGLEPPEIIKSEGVTRFPAFDKDPSNRSAWCCLNKDQTAGFFGDFTANKRWRWGSISTQKYPDSTLDEFIQRKKEKGQQKLSDEEKSKQEKALKIWGASQPAKNTLVETYLAERGITVQLPFSLRFHPDLDHPGNYIFPAMVALVTGAIDGEALAIHRTYLAQDGKGKASVDPAKMMLGKVKGGVVRLGEPTENLITGESIETCLSAMQATGYTAWAALSSSALETLDLPTGSFQRLIVLSDGDDVGGKAAVACARRWITSKGPPNVITKEREACVARPPDGKDFNDLLREGPDGEKLILGIIEKAEKISDLIDDLIDRAEKDPGYPFKQEVLHRIAQKYQEDDGKAYYESLRADFKKQTGVRVTELDKVLYELVGEGETGKDPTQIENLTEIVDDAKNSGEIEIFRSKIDHNQTFSDQIFVNAKITEPGHEKPHRETWTPQSDGFRNWIISKYYKKTRYAPNTESAKAVANLVEAQGREKKATYPVALRVGQANGTLYIDLCDDSWRALEIKASGWRIIDKPPVCFRRADGMLPLPEPIRDATASEALH